MKAKGLYRRKDSSIWWMNFTANGRPYQRSTGTEDYDLAKEILERVKAEIILGQWFDRKEESRQSESFSDFAIKYLNWCKGRQKSYDVKKYVIGQLLERFTDLRLDDFNGNLIEQLQTDHINKGLTPAYINKITAILKHMFSKAVDWEIVSEVVLKKIRRARPLKGENRRLRYLSYEESEALVNACDSLLRPVVITALNTGMRKSEILTLRWDQVDLKHGFILLDKTKNGERREIPINSVLREEFQGLLRRLDSPYVFVNPQTGRPYQKDWKKSFHAALKKAGIRDFVFHDLRHTFASQLVMAGVDLVTVKELLGHKDIKMTLRYAHLAPAHKVKAVEILTRKERNSYDFLTVGKMKGATSLVTP